jgi:predicted transcriptional regulator
MARMKALSIALLLKKKLVRDIKRDVLCYWAVHELGISQTEIARRLGMTVSGIGYAVKRGEVIVRENKYQIDN